MRHIMKKIILLLILTLTGDKFKANLTGAGEL